MASPKNYNTMDPLLGIKDETIATPTKQTALNKYVILVCIATTIGTSVPVGYHFSVINAPAEYIKSWCNESIANNYQISLSINELQTLWASIVSIFLVGGVIGSLCGAWIADKFGRKFTHMAESLLFIIGGVMSFYCRALNSVELLMVARLLLGLAAGITTAITPMYLSEVAPLGLRGLAGTLLSFGAVAGIILGDVLSLDEVLGDNEHWHYGLSAFVLLVVVGILPYYWFPESPKYLYIVAGRKEVAIEELRRLYNNDLALINEEIKLMEDEIEIESKIRSMWSVIVDPALLLPLCLACALQAGHQLSGINTVVYYSVSMMESIGVNSSTAKWINLGIGCTDFAVACSTLLINSRVNRRPVILFSVIGSGILLLMLVIFSIFLDIANWLAYANIAALWCFVLVFEVGLGPIPYFIASELFESAPRPAAMALGGIISWLCNILVGMTFPILQVLWGFYVFLAYAIICFALAVFLKIYLPETRGVEASVVAALVKDGFKSKPLVKKRI